MEFRFEINTRSLVVRSDKASTGEIYFVINEDFFPDNRWNDFVDVILNWWIDEVLLFENGDKDRMDFEFMDGPYKVIITSCDNDKLNLSFCRNEVGILPEVKIQKTEFMIIFKQTINKVLLFYTESKLYSEEFEKLKARFIKLGRGRVSD